MSPREIITKSSKLWLVAGVVLLGLTHMRWGIGVLAWVAPVPFLVYLRSSTGIGSRVLVGLGLFAGYTLAVLKICTAPVSPILAPVFALPEAAMAMGAYLAWDSARKRGPTWLAPLVFAAASAVLEFALHHFTPFGSWGAVAYTQIDNLPLLQVCSLVGMAGVSFVVCWGAAALESYWANPALGLRQLGVAAAVTTAAVGFGTLRLGLAETGETVSVAAIGTDSTVGGFPYPSVEQMEIVNQGLFARTATAASAGAKLVEWTEAATLVERPNEATFLRRLSAAAAFHHIELVASYVVPNDESHTYENKYVWLRPDGAVDHHYLKHHPVPGEPAVAGTGVPRIVETDAGRATGAICYDYDFPALSLAQARLGLDLAVVPSSDWRGIDPIHAQMASLRAIEGGFSLLRSTRFGMSAAFDPYGRARGWQSSFESTTRVMVTALPKAGVRTLYTTIGDSFVLLCALFVVAALTGAKRREKRALTAPMLLGRPTRKRLTA